MNPSGDLPSFLQVSQKPKVSVKARDGEKIALESPSPNTLVYVEDCKNCECELEKKAMKVIGDGCKGCVFNIKSNLLSGMLEFINCENVVVNIIGEVKIWTMTVDGSTNFKMNVQNDSQFESIYIHRCTAFEVNVGTENPRAYPVEIDDPARQYIIHWESEADGIKKFICEKVVRDGIYPTTEKALAETIAKEKEFSEKMANMMVDGIKITKKDPKASTGHVKPTAPKPVAPKPRPAPNIEQDEEKKEFFENKSELSSKLDTLAKWIKESKHCIVFTGAGISTSTGIPDFRSGMNTVLKTGPGVWELKAKGAARSSSAKVTPFLKAVPSVGHMAVVKLHQEGLVKFTVSQNVDGLHLRSGIRPDQLAELHGNTNLEKCTKCHAKYLRDFRTRTAVGVYDHSTGRVCDDPKCKGQLVDSIVNFGENLPEEDLEASFEEASKSDLCIVLGSSLRVTPASEIPATVMRNGQKVVICNLQKTPLNARCALEIHAQIDDVMVGVMQRLGLEIPVFTINRRLAVDLSDDKIAFQGLDVARDTPYSFLRSVEVKFIEGDDKVIGKVVLNREPYVTTLPRGVTKPLKAHITLGLHGHYGEPDIALREEFTKAGRTVYMLSYGARADGAWNVTKK